MATETKPFVVRLTAEQREKLEAYRRAVGARSEAEAVRAMIEALDVVRRIDRAPIDSAAQKGAQATVSRRAAEMAERADRQGAQKFKTRLKGEWRAP